MGEFRLGREMGAERGFRAKSLREQVLDFAEEAGMELKDVSEVDEQRLLGECRRRDECVDRSDLVDLLSEYGLEEDILEGLSLAQN